MIPLIGHGFIDILKIDIEGGEFDSLASFLTSHADGELPIGQLQLEIHAWGSRRRFDYSVRWWESRGGGPAAFLDGAKLGVP
jgi:Methyltransferase FkbM domain